LSDYQRIDDRIVEESVMPGIFFAIITVLSWGTWLSPSQSIPFKNQQIKTFYVALANLVLALGVGVFQGFEGLTFHTFWFPFAGGLIWAVSGYYAFLGTNRIGIARAIGIWAPLNIIVSILWGMILFGEFLQSDGTGILLTILAVGAIIAGISLIIFSREKKTGEKTVKTRNRAFTGILGAVIAGILWGSYFIPIRLSSISMWVAAFPLAVGIFTGSLILVLFTGKSIILEKSSYYVRVFITGLLWGIGNYASLRMMELIGTGRGFTIAQLNVALNALFGIFLFKQPHPKSKAALFTFIGIAAALAGGILLGSLK
jgi:glucose uptake protein